MTVDAAHTFEVLDHCWIFAGEFSQETGVPVMSEGVVIAKINVPHLPYPLHIIQLLDKEYLYHECRDAMLMSPSAHVPPPYAKFGIPATLNTRYNKRLN